MDNIFGSKDIISVVIPFCLKKRRLNEALNGIHLQTLLMEEIVAVNAGTNENIDSQISKILENVIAVYQNNSGFTSARKRSYSNFFYSIFLLYFKWLIRVIGR